MAASMLRSLIPERSQLTSPHAFGFNFAIAEVTRMVAFIEAQGYVLTLSENAAMTAPIYTGPAPIAPLAVSQENEE